MFDPEDSEICEAFLFNMVKKSLDKEIEYLLPYNKYLNESIFILGMDKTKNGYFIIQDDYGLLSVAKRNLKDGCKPTITSAINKLEYFKNLLYSRNEYYRNGEFEVLEFYPTKVICQDKYGIMHAAPSDLFKNYKCGIRGAVDKLEYFKGRLKEENNYYKNGEFEIISEYIGRDHGKMTIETKCCGIQEVRADSLLTYKPADYSNINRIQENKYKKYFYVIRLFNEEESFYKVGVTDLVERRLRDYALVYKAELVFLESKLDSPTFAYDMEQKIIKEFENYKYIPKKYFSGYSECLTIDPIPFCYS